MVRNGVRTRLGVVSRGVNEGGGPLPRVRALLASELVSDVLIPFACLRTVLFAIGLGAMRVFTNVPGFHSHAAPFVDGFIRWDAVYYLQVAQDGYGGPADAFFPAYPMFARLVAYAMPLPYAAVVVSTAANLAVLALLHRWVRFDHDRDTARASVVVALLFPTSFFLTVAYAESTYLAFLLGAFVAERSDRRLVAALCVTLACLSRPQGFVCATLPFLVAFLASRPTTVAAFRRAPWPVLGALVAFGILLTLHRRATGDPLGFLHARTVQSLGAFRGGGGDRPPVLEVLWDEGFGPNLVRRILNWSALALVGAATIALARTRRLAEATVCVGAIALPLWFHRTIFDAASMARYALLAFPIYPYLASLRTSETRRMAMDASFAMAGVVLFAAYTGWYWLE